MHLTAVLLENKAGADASAPVACHESSAALRYLFPSVPRQARAKALKLIASQAQQVLHSNHNGDPKAQSCLSVAAEVEDTHGINNQRAAFNAQPCAHACPSTASNHCRSSKPQAARASATVGQQQPPTASCRATGSASAAPQPDADCPIALGLQAAPRSVIDSSAQSAFAQWAHLLFPRQPAGGLVQKCFTSQHFSVQRLGDSACSDGMSGSVVGHDDDQVRIRTSSVLSMYADLLRIGALSLQACVR